MNTENVIAIHPPPAEYGGWGLSAPEFCKEAEYAWYQKYGGSDNYCGGY